MPGTTFSTANWSGYDEHSADISPAASLTAFSLMLDVSRFSAAWKAAVQSDGADIRCTDESDTEIPYDLIDWQYNAGAPTGWIRAKRSLTTSDSTQKVRVYAGYTGGTATAYDATETYGSNNAYASHWEAYWPLHDLNDRTANNNDLTAFNSPTSGATGKLGTCYDLDAASSQYLQISSALATAAPLTLMCWANTTDTTNSQYAVSVNDGALDPAHQFSLNWGGNAAGDPVRNVVQAGAAGTISVAATSTGFGSGAWHHGVAKFTSSTSRDALIDGGSKGSGTTSRTPSGVDRTQIARNGGGNYFDGLIDDVQVHSAALSDDWIAHEYDQTNSQSTFWGTWSWTSLAAGGGVPAGSLSLLGVGI